MLGEIYSMPPPLRKLFIFNMNGKKMLWQMVVILTTLADAIAGEVRETTIFSTMFACLPGAEVAHKN